MYRNNNRDNLPYLPPLPPLRSGVSPLSPGSLGMAPSAPSAGSRRIIPSDRPTHPGGPTPPSGAAQSAVPDARTAAGLVAPVAVTELVG
jgi:hypothetical protein